MTRGSCQSPSLFCKAQEKQTFLFSDGCTFAISGTVRSGQATGCHCPGRWGQGEGKMSPGVVSKSTLQQNLWKAAMTLTEKGDL